MDRRQFLRGAAVSAGAVALAGIPSAAFPIDPVVSIAQEWVRLDHISLNDMTDEEGDAICDRLGELMERLLQTPATTVDGVRAKLHVLYRWQGFEDASGAPPTDYGGRLVCSLFADATSLSAS